MGDDIVTRLHTPHVDPCICVDVVRAECRSCCDRIDARTEIVRLRAKVERKADYAERMDALAEERLIGWNRERALADQLAQALRWSWELEDATHDEVFGVMASAANALAYYDIVRKEKNE